MRRFHLVQLIIPFTTTTKSSPVRLFSSMSVPSYSDIGSISEFKQRTPRLLSIQSHTTHGYVGNKAATFPLQLFGFDVNCINSISLSNHPSYAGGFKIGQSLEGADLDRTIDGLKSNNLLDYDVVVSGYTRSPELLLSIANAVAEVKNNNEDVIYVCDPVLGDNGNFYVPKELMEIYKTKVLPLASVITPNKFEVEVLSGRTVKTFHDALEACKVLHSLGPNIVFMTGLDLSSESFATPEGTAKEHENEKNLSVLVSFSRSTDDENDSEFQTYSIDLPQLEGRFSGCGDLFTAMVAAGMFYQKILHKASSFLALFEKSHHLLGNILEMSTNVLASVLKKTQLAGTAELQIIESAELFQTTASAFLTDHKNSKDRKTTPQLSLSLGQRLSYLASSSEAEQPIGIIFDMDGTLTEPGAIDFPAMFRRLNITRESIPEGDLIGYIQNLPSVEERDEAWAMIEEEEMLACDRMVVRPDVLTVVAAIRRAKIRTAVATRNIEKAYERFLQQAGLATCQEQHAVFSPAVFRDSLGGVNKPDPKVAMHIMEDWKIPPRMRSAVWFVGDSIDDISCGRNAGCRTCLVLTDSNRHLQKERPELIDLAVENLIEFVHHLDLPSSGCRNRRSRS